MKHYHFCLCVSYVLLTHMLMACVTVCAGFSSGPSCKNTTDTLQGCCAHALNVHAKVGIYRLFLESVSNAFTDITSQMSCQDIT